MMIKKITGLLEMCTKCKLAPTPSKDEEIPNLFYG